jgi:hypothetical protein
LSGAKPITLDRPAFDGFRGRSTHPTNWRKLLLGK